MEGGVEGGEREGGGGRVGWTGGGERLDGERGWREREAGGREGREGAG